MVDITKKENKVILPSYLSPLRTCQGPLQCLNGKVKWWLWGKHQYEAWKAT